MTHHRRGLLRLIKDEELVGRILDDFESAGLTDRQVAMLRYADKLTRTPAQVTAEDVRSLVDAGWSDRDVLAIAEVTSYYAYANRIVDGLGVELEE